LVGSNCNWAFASKINVGSSKQVDLSSPPLLIG
jgi:hypothetical protein